VTWHGLGGGRASRAILALGATPRPERDEEVDELAEARVGYAIG